MSLLIRFSLAHPWLVILGAWTLFAVSFVVSFRLPLDALPDIVSLEMEVNTNVDALSPEEIESQVTVPLERALAGMPGLATMRSTSEFGLSQIQLIFKDKVSIVATRQLINERLQSIQDILPTDTHPLLAPVKSGLGEILYYSIDYADKAPEYGKSRVDQLISLKRYQTYTLGPQIEALPGVAEVSITGGYSPQINIDIDPKRLISSDIDWLTLNNSLRRSALRPAGGVLQFSDNQVTVASSCNLTEPAQIGDLPIHSRGTKAVSLRDIANVYWGTEPRTGASTENGRESLVVAVVMQRGENARLVTQLVAKELQVAKETLPQGMSLHILYNRGDLIQATIQTILKNLLLGVSIVILVLFILLGNWRAALIVGTTIPLAFYTALLGLKMLSYSGNLISLGAVDFGLIVDGAVVLTENIVRRLAHKRAQSKGVITKEEKCKTIEFACKEVARPVIFGVCIITLVYVPIFAFTGVEGKMFESLAVTLIIALAAALLITLTLIPSLSLVTLGCEDLSENDLWHKIMQGYGTLLVVAFRFRSFVVSCSLALVVISLMCFMHLGGIFIPTLREGTILMAIERPANLNLAASVEEQMMTEKIVLNDFPEVERTFSRVGSDDQAVDAVSANEADTYLILNPSTKWPRINGQLPSREDLLNSIQNDINQKIPGQLISFSQPVEDRFNDFLEGARADFVIKVFGEDLTELERLGTQIRDLTGIVKGAEDVSFDLAGRNQTLDIHPMAEQLKLLGLSPIDINQQVLQPLAGEEMGVLLINGYPVDEVLRLPPAMRNSIESVSALPILLANGNSISLQNVSTIVSGTQLNEIEHDSGHRRVAITVNIRGRDAAGFIDEVQRRIAQNIKLPNGYVLDYGGHYRAYKSAFTQLRIVIPLILILIFILVWSSCQSWREAFIVLTGVPFAYTGGVIALIMHGLPLSIPAAIGFIALSGIAVLNGLVLVSCIKLLASSMNWMEAITKGAQLRLRPVLMTALVGAFGFLPMAFAHGTGAEIQQPLATVVIGGIISSSFLTLFIVPILLYGRYPDSHRPRN